MRNYLLPMGVASLIAMSSSAVALDLPQDQYHQDFSGYENSFDRGSWELIYGNDNPFYIAYPYSSLNQTAKDLYSIELDGQHLLIFDARWRRATLKEMLDDQFKPLVKEDGIKPNEIRQALDDADCSAYIEVGTSNTYGFPAGNNVIELDGDTYLCNANQITLTNPAANNAIPTIDKSGKPSALRLRTFVPTIPGATYSFDIYYNKRLNAAGRFDENDALITKVRAKSFDSVLLDGYATPIVDNSFEGGRIELPYDVNATTHDGFYKATITFIAQDYFTRVILRGNDASESFGPIVNKVQSTKISVPEAQFDMCSMFYDYGSKNFKKCMHAEGDNYNFACDFTNDDPNDPNSVKYIINKPGIHTPGNAQRYIPKNMSVLNRIDGNGSLGTYYSVGLEGKTTVKLNCPVAGQTLKLNEFTNGINQDINSYPEQGKVKAKIKCLDDGNEHHGWVLLTKNSANEDDVEDNFLVTNEYLSYDFNAESYKGCLMTKLVFIDKTSDLPNAPVDTDGFEVQGLQFVETPQ